MIGDYILSLWQVARLYIHTVDDLRLSISAIIFFATDVIVSAAINNHSSRTLTSNPISVARFVAVIVLRSILLWRVDLVPTTARAIRTNIDSITVHRCYRCCICIVVDCGWYSLSTCFAIVRNILYPIVRIYIIISKIFFIRYSLRILPTEPFVDTSR